MGDKNITLFALHTHGDNQFGPSSMPGGSTDESNASESGSKAKSLFGSKSSESDDAAGASAAPEDDSGGSAIVGLVVALVVLGGIAMVAKKLRGGKETAVDVTESDDL